VQLEAEVDCFSENQIAHAFSVISPNCFGGTKMFNLKQQPTVFGTASQSTKRQDMPEIGGSWHAHVARNYSP